MRVRDLVLYFVAVRRPQSDETQPEEVYVRTRRCVLAALVAGATALGTAAPAVAKDAAQLKVRLTEFKVKPAREFIAAGKTKVVAKNAGGDEHELVIVRGDDIAALPTKADGSVNESKIPKSDVLGEIEDIKPGKTKSKVFKLSSGSYILFCNIVEEEKDGTLENHLVEGMYTTIEAS